MALTPEFSDHFSDVAGAYAAFRPRYPATLFAFLSQLAPHHDHAWDCATGNGQAAIGLAEHFTTVTATDASAEQIAASVAHPRITYRVAPADHSGLAAGSVAIVTVAQALHWLDRAAFYAEVRRVGAPDGVIAAWSYGRLTIASADNAIDRIIGRFYEETVGPFWPDERRLVEDGYRSIEFPFTPVDAPAFAIEHTFTLAELGGYLGTWSATRGFIARHAHDPVPEVLDRLRESWGPPELPRLTRFPLALLVGRC